MARILIIGGGRRGRALVAAMVKEEGHAVRITTRSEEGRAAIEAVGAECWVGTPDRLATLRGALDRVAVCCWLLGSATGSAESLRALYTSRLELFLTQMIDTTVRGFVYEARGGSPGGDGGNDNGGEAAGAVTADVLAEGERLVRAMTERNAIPCAVLDANQSELDSWLVQTRAAIDSLLAPS